MKHIDPIIHREEEITICAGDCMYLKELFEHEFTGVAIMQQELYNTNSSLKPF